MSFIQLFKSAEQCFYSPTQTKGTAFQMGKVSSNTNEYQFFAVKLAADAPETLSCVESCALTGNKVAKSAVKPGHCLIDNVCYEEGATAEIFGRPCMVCNPSNAGSQTEWSLAATVGESVCFINNVCQDAGDYYTFRESRSMTYTSLCQHCSPTDNSLGWFIDSVNFDFVADVEPPNDCLNKTVTTAESAANAEGQQKQEEESQLPTPSPTKPTVPIISVPVTEMLEPPIEESSPDKATPVATPDDAATPAETTTDTTTPVGSASKTDTDNSGSKFSRISIVGITSAIATVMLI